MCSHDWTSGGKGFLEAAHGHSGEMGHINVKIRTGTKMSLFTLIFDTQIFRICVACTGAFVLLCAWFTPPALVCLLP